MAESSVQFFDSHLHIIDPQFPLFENHGYMPETFTVEDYQRACDDYRIYGGAVVSGSFQQQDQSYLIDALDKLGAGFVGVTQLLADTCDQEILKLSKSGVRAVRFNLYRGGSESVEKMREFAHRIFDLAQWHIELYVDSSDLKDLYPVLKTLPCVSIDHLGLTRTGYKYLLKLVEAGTKVKATGFGRLDFDCGVAMQELYHANPACLMFGTDLPSTRAPRAFSHEDILFIQNAFGEPAVQKILYKNAQDFYIKRLM